MQCDAINEQSKQTKLFLQITLPLSKKLGELKEALGENDYFGPLSVEQEQRIFYLGRELKSAGRTLLKLGLGQKYNNHVLHVHITPASSSSTRDSSASSGSKRRRAPVAASLKSDATAGGVIDLLDDSDEEATTLLENNPNGEGNKQRRY